MKNTLDVRTVALNRALQLLDSIGARYKVITPDGAEYGVLVAVEPKANRPLRYPFGAVRNYYRPFIEPMIVGDVVEIPVGVFDLTTIQNGAGALAAELWGQGAAITRMDREKNVIEVLRVL